MRTPMQERRALWLQGRAAYQEQERRARELREALWCGCQFDHEDPAFLNHPHAADHKRAIAFQTPIIEVHPLEVPAVPAHAHEPARTRARARTATVTHNLPESYGLKVNGKLVPRYVPEDVEAA